MPQSYIDKWKGRFDEGWDVVRERIYEQQKKLGVIPKDTKLAAKPDDIKDWKDLSDKEKKLFARQAEVFAAFLDMTDHETGRVLQAIEDMGEIDNTLIIYIAGDNGTSAEGGMSGLYNEMTYFNAEPKGSDVDFMLEHYDTWGGPTTYPHMAAGWAVAFDSPFTWTKQVASNYGGTRNPLIVHWPKRIKGKGEMRSQWHHVIDIVPTILEAAGLPQPRVVNGMPQRPIEGVSMVYTWDYPEGARPTPDPVLRDVRQPRPLLRRLVCRDRPHQAVGQGRESLPRGHLGALPRREDFSMSTDLAKKHPEMLDETAAGVPRRGGQVQGAAARRPAPGAVQSEAGRAARSDVRAHEPDAVRGHERPARERLHQRQEHVVRDRRRYRDRRRAGQRRHRGPGRSLRRLELVREGRHVPTFTYNYLGIDVRRATASAAASQRQVDREDGLRLRRRKKPGAGGTATLYIDGKSVGSTKVAKTEFAVFSADETAGVGVDTETPVSDDYDRATSKFTGKIDKVTINLK